MVSQQAPYTAPTNSIKHVQLISSSRSITNMAASRSHASSSHGRLHKRGNSASSLSSPLSPLSADSANFAFTRSETPKVTYEEPWEYSQSRPTASSNPLKIKPYLRKLSSKEGNSLDLSRPAAENEGMAGLGINEYGTSRSVSDVTFSPTNGRNRHRRSTSNTSQFSTTSSLQRPSAPYMPFIRQTTRPYTPPISKSTPSSLMGSEHEEADDIISEEEFRLRQNMFDPARRSGSVSSVPGITPPLRIHTTTSAARLGGSYSQTSLSLTSPIVGSRSRGDTLKSIDTTSPSSRTSFDQTFRFIRGGRDSPVDPASRAASIRAARQAYEEKEAAKDRKAEKEATKKEEKDNRKKSKQEERQRRKSDAEDKKRTRSISNETVPSAVPVGGTEYSNYKAVHNQSLPARVATAELEKDRHTAPQVTTRRAAKGRWLAFITWFKTRLLRISRKLHMSS